MSAAGFKRQVSDSLRRLLRRKRLGYVERLTPERVSGWVAGGFDTAKPALLTLHVDGRHALNIPADKPRADVLETGVAPLHCGFDAALPRSLRDGRAHLVELRLGLDGPVMPGGRLKIAGSDKGSAPDSLSETQDDQPALPAEAQGVAYFDFRRGAIAGWAMGCGAVSVALPGRPAVSLLLDREVPGLGGGAQHGFLLPIPVDLMDGMTHQAEVSFDLGGEPGSDMRGGRLDGSPVSFRLRPTHPLVEVVSLIGPELRLNLRDAHGNPADLPVMATVDGQPLALRRSEGMLCATLPETGRELVLLDAGETPALPLSRHLITPAHLIDRDLSDEGPGAEIPPSAPASPVPASPVLATPLLARLPAPTQSLTPAQSIYTAWAARLNTDDETRLALTLDEAQARQAITATPLTRAPLISIIMPSYNRAYTIGDAIQSVLEQSYQNWELLVCDDASEDKTAEVLRGFADPRIRSFRFTKSNGAATRNKGLRFARGEYIAYLDSDNLWHPQFLDLMLRQLRASPGSALAYCAYLDTEIVGARVDLHKIGRAPFRSIALSSRNFMDLNTILHHRRIYDWMGGFDESLPRLQDWDLMLRYTSIFEPLYVDHVGVFYRRNVGWGQVTHLFQGSGAQNTVNDKTQRRLTQSHETLQIAWPARPRVTVLSGGAGFDSHLLAESLARLAATLADVDLLEFGGESAATGAGDPPGLRRHRVPALLRDDPYRLGHAMAPLLQGRAVLAFGLPADLLRAVPGLSPQSVCLPGIGSQGVALHLLSDPGIRFSLGALPLPLPDPAPSEGPVLLLIPPTGAAGAPANLAALAKSVQMTLLLPPGAGAPALWHLLADGNIRPLAATDPALPGLLARCTLAASLPPVSAISSLDFTLLAALQARGMPLAVPREAAGDALANQWIEARAAYEIKVAKPKWLFEKLAKLQADAQGKASLAERGLRVHQIALHPELTRERLAHLIWRLMFDPPHAETRHANL